MRQKTPIHEVIFLGPKIREDDPIITVEIPMDIYREMSDAGTFWQDLEEMTGYMHPMLYCVEPFQEVR